MSLASEGPDLVLLMSQVVDGDDFRATGSALRRWPVLLDSGSAAALNELSAEAVRNNNPDRVALLRQFSAFLERCRYAPLDAIFPVDNKFVDPMAFALVSSAMDVAEEADAAYRRTRDAVQLDRAVDAWQQVIGHVGLEEAYPALRAALSNNAGSVFLTRYLAAGDQQDLRSSVEAFRVAIALTPFGSERRAGRLGNLGVANREEYRLTGDEAALGLALEAFRTAKQAASGPAARSSALANLALALRERFLLHGRGEDLDQALELAGQACAAESTIAAQAMLADVLRLKFERDGDLADLNSALRIQETVLAATSPTAPDHARRQVDLAVCLMNRHAAYGNVSDLAEALSLLTSAEGTIQVTSPDYPTALANLSLVHLRAYESNGSLEELDTAVAHLHVLIQRTGTAGSDAMTWTADLAMALQERGRRTGDTADRDSAIALLQGLYDGPSAGFHLFLIANSLGNALSDRFGVNGNIADLDLAIDVLSSALDAAPERSRQVATISANLGSAYCDRYRVSASQGDLERALDLTRDAVRLSGTSEQDRARRLFAFAVVARTSYALTGDTDDLEAAERAFAEGCGVGSSRDVRETLLSSQEWGHWAVLDQRWSAATKAFRVAGLALRTIVRAQLTLDHKESWLHETLLLATHRAYAHTKLDQVLDAVVAIEEGRAAMLTEALLRDRADLRILADERPDLAERFTTAARRVRRLAGVTGFEGRPPR